MHLCGFRSNMAIYLYKPHSEKNWPEVQVTTKIYPSQSSGYDSKCWLIVLLKSKITKMLNSEENLKRKVSHQIAKLNDKTHQTIEQLSYSWLGTGISNIKWCGKPIFIALNLSLVWQSHQIPLYLQQCMHKTDIQDKIVKIWVQQSSLCHNLKTNIYLTKKHKKHLSNLSTKSIISRDWFIKCKRHTGRNIE